MLSKYCPEMAQETHYIQIIVLAVCQRLGSSHVSLLIIIPNVNELPFPYPSFCLKVVVSSIVSHCVLEITLDCTGVFYYYWYICGYCLASVWGLASDPFIVGHLQRPLEWQRKMERSEPSWSNCEEGNEINRKFIWIFFFSSQSSL